MTQWTNEDRQLKHTEGGDERFLLLLRSGVPTSGVMSGCVWTSHPEHSEKIATERQCIQNHIFIRHHQALGLLQHGTRAHSNIDPVPAPSVPLPLGGCSLLWPSVHRYFVLFSSNVVFLAEGIEVFVTRSKEKSEPLS